MHHSRRQLLRPLIGVAALSLGALALLAWPGGGAASEVFRAEQPVVRPLVQQSRCADCHFANLDAPARQHLNEWDLSAHGRNEVGCESCHGGDPTTFESFVAHAGIVGSNSPRSTAHRSNLPGTCGTCHASPFVAFQESRHFALLETGDARVPTCSTCHGSVSAQLLSPRALEAECANCHGSGETYERPEAPRQARQLLESIVAVRTVLDDARRLIDRVEDDEQKNSLEYDYRQAEVPLIEAATAGHAFQFNALEERLGTATRRADALMERLIGSVQQGVEGVGPAAVSNR
jgi:hypothetical protein